MVLRRNRDSRTRKSPFRRRPDFDLAERRLALGGVAKDLMIHGRQRFQVGVRCNDVTTPDVNFSRFEWRGRCRTVCRPGPGLTFEHNVKRNDVLSPWHHNGERMNTQS